MRRFIALIALVISSFIRDRCLSFAAAISYWALFSIFPMLLLTMAMLSLFISSAHDRAGTVEAVFNLLGQSVARETIRDQVDGLASSGGSIGLFGLVLAIWSASGVFGAVREGMAAVWGAGNRRPFIQGKLIDLTMLLTVGVLMVLSVLSTGLLTAAETLIPPASGSAIAPVARAAVGLVYFVVPPALSYGAFALIYFAVPRGGLRLADVWEGALVAAILFEIAQIGFSVYLSHFADYGRIYGSLGAAIALLFFMYLSAAILLLGAEVTKATLGAGGRSLTLRAGSP